MTDPREDDLRATYETVADELEELGAVEREKQTKQPGTEEHASLAAEARERAKKLGASTAAQAELADELRRDPPKRS